MLIGIVISISIGENTPVVVDIQGAGQVQRLYGGIDQSGSELGDPDAPVTISIFNDLQCDSCSDYHAEIVPPLVESLVRTGKAKLEFRHFSLSQREVNVGAIGATAAGDQASQWQFIDLFFLNQDEVAETGVSQEYLEGVASEIPGEGFSLAKWREDFNKDSTLEEVNVDAELSTDLRLPTGPAVIVEGPGGTGSERLERSPDLERILAAVDAVS